MWYLWFDKRKTFSDEGKRKINFTCNKFTNEKAFIFSIDLNKKYPFKNKDGYSLYCNASYGIYFGDSTFNIKNLTNGSLNSSYSYDINYEFNDNSTNFQCSDIEIYKIIK